MSEEVDKMKAEKDREIEKVQKQLSSARTEKESMLKQSQMLTNSLTDLTQQLLPSL